MVGSKFSGTIKDIFELHHNPMTWQISSILIFTSQTTLFKKMDKITVNMKMEISWATTNLRDIFKQDFQKKMCT